MPGILNAMTLSTLGLYPLATDVTDGYAVVNVDASGPRGAREGVAQADQC